MRRPGWVFVAGSPADHCRAASPARAAGPIAPLSMEGSRARASGVAGSAQQSLHRADVGARVAWRLELAGFQLAARSRVLQRLVGGGRAAEQVLVGGPRREDAARVVVPSVFAVQPPE